MQLHFKPASKIVEPQSVVEPIFKAQGFEKRKRKDLSYFHLKMRDSTTRTLYEIQVPFQELFLNANEPHYKLHDIFIYTKTTVNKNHRIPIPIVNAAKEKVNEVYSYLATSSNHSRKAVNE